jgi:uncharacterized cupredoxin-like copper-binding protein
MLSVSGKIARLTLAGTMMGAVLAMPAAAQMYCGLPPSGPRIYLFGEPGNFALLTRTVKITMFEAGFVPDHVETKRGETIHFVVTNDSHADHHFTLGDEVMLSEHRAALVKDSGSPSAIPIHHGAHSLVVPAGKTRVLDWTFSIPGDFEFERNTPGSSEADIRGRISVK